MNDIRTSGVVVDPLREGPCPLFEQVTVAQIRDPGTGRPRTVRVVDGSRPDMVLFGWQMRLLVTGDGPLLRPLEYESRHRSRCPRCRIAALPGPRMVGWWIAEDWQAATRYDAVSGDAGLEVFANLTEAHARTARRLRAMRRHRTVPGGAVLVHDLRVPVDGRPAEVGPVFVSASAHLWLWDDLEAARARRLPARLLRVRAGQIESLAGRAEITGAVNAVRRSPPAPADAGSGTFRTTLLDGYTIGWIPGDATVMSIRHPADARPAYRLHADGSTTPLPGAPPGLVVLGTHRGDRPALHRLGQWLPGHAPLADRLRAGHGVTL